MIYPVGNNLLQALHSRGVTGEHLTYASYAIVVIALAALARLCVAVVRKIQRSWTKLSPAVQTPIVEPSVREGEIKNASASTRQVPAITESLSLEWHAGNSDYQDLMNSCKNECEPFLSNAGVKLNSNSRKVHVCFFQISGNRICWDAAVAASSRISSENNDNPILLAHSVPHSCDSLFPYPTDLDLFPSMLIENGEGIKEVESKTESSKVIAFISKNRKVFSLFGFVERTKTFQWNFSDYHPKYSTQFLNSLIKVLSHLYPAPKTQSQDSTNLRTLAALPLPQKVSQSKPLDKQICPIRLTFFTFEKYLMPHFAHLLQEKRADVTYDLAICAQDYKYPPFVTLVVADVTKPRTWNSMHDLARKAVAKRTDEVVKLNEQFAYYHHAHTVGATFLMCFRDLKPGESPKKSFELPPADLFPLQVFEDGTESPREILAEGDSKGEREAKEIIAFRTGDRKIIYMTRLLENWSIDQWSFSNRHANYDPKIMDYFIKMLSIEHPSHKA